MPFQKGQSGNPSGKNKRPIFEALTRAVAAEDAKRVRAMVEKVLELAATGERWACEYVRDVLDGRPNQSIDLSGEVVQRFVARLPEVIEDSDAWRRKYAPPTVQ